MTLLSNWIHLKAHSTQHSVFNGLYFRMLPSSRDTIILDHHDTALTPARYVGIQQNNKVVETTPVTSDNDKQQPKLYFEMAPSTITPRCYTFNNKR